jgi:L-aminopeptidase/D-esterase-like protein
VNRAGSLAAYVVAEAVVNAVRAAESLLGVPSSHQVIGRKQ